MAVRYEYSFFHFTTRRKLMPQICGPGAGIAQRLERDRTSPNVHPPSNRPVRTSHTVFQFAFSASSTIA